MQYYELASRELDTVRDFIRYGLSEMNRAGVYFGHGTDNALDESTALVLHALAMPHDLPGHFMDARVTEGEKQQIAELLYQRIQERIPLAYLTHEAWFAGLQFYVDERVLIPRSPIAELIDQHFEPWLEPQGVHRILDMCTGSACIAIACAYQFPEAQVDAVDISEDALQVARINIEGLGVGDQVHPIQSDLFDTVEGRYDLIVSNPPYVDQQEIDAMSEEYHKEPRLGLASGQDGLDATRKILAHAEDHLNDGGILIVEVGASDLALEAAFPQVPFTWLEFENGGSGIFLLTKEQLSTYRDVFR